MKENTARSYLTSAQRRKLKEQQAKVPGATRREFEVAFDDWSKTWFSGGLAINSDLHTRGVGNEYDRLIALGPNILPLVVEKLADPITSWPFSFTMRFSRTRDCSCSLLRMMKES
jgi:hypothetical protein